MSSTSKVVLFSTAIGTVGLIVFVHWQQENAIEQMHEGINKDIERVRLKKQKQELEKQVSDTRPPITQK